MKEYDSYLSYEKYIKKNYPHQSRNDIRIGYYAHLENRLKVAESNIKHGVNQQNVIRAGYHKRMVELIDLIKRMLDDPGNTIKPIYNQKFKEAT